MDLVLDSLAVDRSPAPAAGGATPTSAAARLPAWVMRPSFGAVVGVATALSLFTLLMHPPGFVLGSPVLSTTATVLGAALLASVLLLYARLNTKGQAATA